MVNKKHDSTYQYEFKRIKQSIPLFVNILRFCAAFLIRTYILLHNQSQPSTHVKAEMIWDHTLM